jgi:hypothetical protein
MEITTVSAGILPRYHLHKGGSDRMDGGFFFHINRHIEAVSEMNPCHEPSP